MNHHQAPPSSTLSPEQCRAARAALGLILDDLIEATGCSRKTIVKFEAGGEVRTSIVARLKAALTARGAVFAADGRGLSW